METPVVGKTYRCRACKYPLEPQPQILTIKGLEPDEFSKSQVDETVQFFNEEAAKLGLKETGKKYKSAADFLNAALSHMQDRATTYDKPQGERSMGNTIAAFNIITGHQLTEEQGWLLMGLLKMVRSQQGNYKADNYEDEAAYAGLRGECAERERGTT